MTSVVFDVAELAPGMGKSMGIYNYAVNMFRHLLPLLQGDLRVHVACNRGCAPDFAAPGHANVVLHEVLSEEAPGTLARQHWIRFGAQAFARRVGAPVYFSPKGFLPGLWGRASGLKTAVVLHDLIPLWYAEHCPGHVGWLEEQVVNRALLRTARHADELIVISRATALDVQRRVQREASRMHVVYNGVPYVKPRGERPLAHPYLFAVTSGLPHKNASGVLASYARYRELVSEPLPLVVCGIADPGQPGVTVIRGVDAETLHTYYAHAELFLFLSLIEGFGFPPLEAMLHGTPVLCSDIEVLREVTHGAVDYADPARPEQVGAHIAALLKDHGKLKAMREVSKTVAHGYDWTKCAQDVLDIWKVLGGSVK